LRGGWWYKICILTTEEEEKKMREKNPKKLKKLYLYFDWLVEKFRSCPGILFMIKDISFDG
jgi:hypothetical protein